MLFVKIHFAPVGMWRDANYASTDQVRVYVNEGAPVIQTLYGSKVGAVSYNPRGALKEVKE